MLALTRKKDEAIIIDGNIEIKVLDIQGDKIKLGISAPKEVTIYRQEIYDLIKVSNEGAQQIEPENKNTITHLNKLVKKSEN